MLHFLFLFLFLFLFFYGIRCLEAWKKKGEYWSSLKPTAKVGSNKGNKTTGGTPSPSPPNKAIVGLMNHLRSIHINHEFKMKLDPISTAVSKVEQPIILEMYIDLSMLTKTLRISI